MYRCGVYRGGKDPNLEGLGEELHRSEDAEERDNGENGQTKEGGKICVGVGGCPLFVAHGARPLRSSWQYSSPTILY